MLCLRCRVLPSAFRTYMSSSSSTSAMSQMTRYVYSTQIPNPYPYMTPMETNRHDRLQTSTPSFPLRTFSSAISSSSPIQQALRRPSTTTTQSLLRTSLSGAAPGSGSAQTRSFSASASLAGKRTTYNPSRRVQKRRHGFLARLRTRAGRKILKNRKAKGRKYLSW